MSFLGSALGQIVTPDVANEILVFNSRGDVAPRPSRADLERARGLVVGAQQSVSRAEQLGKQAVRQAGEAQRVAGLASSAATRAQENAKRASILTALNATDSANRYAKKIAKYSHSIRDTHLTGTGFQRDVQKAAANAAYVNQHTHRHIRPTQQSLHTHKGHGT